jgi:enoyl-CoA hydratase
MSDTPGSENLLVERRGEIGLITLNRPMALDALNAALISELAAGSTISKPMSQSALSY